MDPTAFTIAAVTDDLGVEPHAREHADVLEYRMDHAADPLTALQDYTGTLPILVTNRLADEGGHAPDTETRLNHLETAVEHDAVHAIDIELTTVKTDRGTSLLRHAREHDATIVASHHDFEATPDQDTLESILARTATAGDIGKVAVTATDTTDALTLLTATHTVTDAGHNVATIAMGDPGRHTRVVAPIYGSRIAYAPVVEADATAPGQYDLPTLTHLLTSLR